MVESKSPDWGLCDHFLLALDHDDDVEEDYGDEWDESEEDDEWPLAPMARLAAEIKAGRAEVPRGWQLDRPGPGILVWTTPSGRRYATTLTGEWLPVPGQPSLFSAGARGLAPPHMTGGEPGRAMAGGIMPATLQPVIVTPSLPLLLAFYKALLGAVEISRMPQEGPAFHVGLQIGNAELGVVADGDADVIAPQRILLNVNVADLGVGDVESLLEHVEALGGRILGPPNDMPWGQRVAHILDPDGNTVNLTEPSSPISSACCLLPAACCLLPAACCLLPAACCLLPAACCLLPAACCLLPAACCPLPAMFRPASHYSRPSQQTCQHHKTHSYLFRIDAVI